MKEWDHRDVQILSCSCAGKITQTILHLLTPSSKESTALLSKGSETQLSISCSFIITKNLWYLRKGEETTETTDLLSPSIFKLYKMPVYVTTEVDLHEPTVKLKVLDKLHGCTSQSISSCSNTWQRKRCPSLIKDKVILGLVLWTCFRMHPRYKGEHKFKILDIIRLECRGEVCCPSESTPSWRNKKTSQLNKHV